MRSHLKKIHPKYENDTNKKYKRWEKRRGRFVGRLISNFSDR